MPLKNKDWNIGNNYIISNMAFKVNNLSIIKFILKLLGQHFLKVQSDSILNWLSTIKTLL